MKGEPPGDETTTPWTTGIRAAWKPDAKAGLAKLEKFARWLERDIAELLTRPVGRPSHQPVVWYKSFLYQAESWTKARRVVAKVELHPGELFPRVGFIVTNLEPDSRTTGGWPLPWPRRGGAG